MRGVMALNSLDALKCATSGNAKGRFTFRYFRDTSNRVFLADIIAVENIQ